MDRVKLVVSYINLEGLIGPHGFGGCFYTICWEIISGDFLKAV